MAFRLARLPATPEELYWYVRARYGLTIPRTQVCPDHVSPFQAFSDAYFAVNTIDPESDVDFIALWHGSRGLSGKSVTLSILGLTLAELLGADVNLLGGSLAQSMNIHEHIGKALRHDNAPTYMLEEESNTKIVFSNGAHIRPLTASPTTVRGPHPPRILLDEIDEMKLTILDAALGQPMPQPNYLGQEVREYSVLCSTWQHPQGCFAEVKRRAEEKGWPVYTWCVASGSRVLTARGEVPIQEVTDHDLVLTRKGWRHVQHVTLMGYKATVALHIGDRQLRLTADHLVATPAGWREAGALAADAMASARPDPGVPGRELVPLAAVGGPGLMLPGALLVDRGGDQVEVLDVDTAAVSAQVIGIVPVRDRARHLQPDPAMGRHGGSSAAPERDVLEPIAVAFAERPVDAGSGEHGNRIEAVYDIGVEGEHEFVVEGVVVHNCYRESANPVDGWLSQQTIRKKRHGTSDVMWETEYELNEPSADAHGFDRAWVEKTFSLPFEPIRKAQAKDFEEYTFADPVREGVYVAGADWAKEKDYTVIAVGRVDVAPHTLVYYMKVNRRPYPTMIGYFNKALNRYKAFGKHDSTGLGNVIDGYVDLRADGFSMTGEKRNSMLSQWVNAVESGRWRMPKVKSAYMAHKFCKVGDLYSHKQEFHLPDEVCAMALMQAAAESLPPLVAPLPVGHGEALTAAEEQFQHRPRAVGEVTSSRDEPTFTMLV